MTAATKRLNQVLALTNVSLVGPLTEVFDPQKFFCTEERLFLWSSFKDRVLTKAKPCKPTAAVNRVAAFDCTRNAYDREIKADLPKRHNVELWQIAQLINGQINGEDGQLLIGGNANIFYVPDFAIAVRWDAHARAWRVDAWRLDEGDWDAGDRVFSSNVPR